MDFLNHGLIKDGGPLMWPMLLMSIVGFIFFVERTLYLHRGQLGVAAFIAGIKNLLEKRRLVEALTVCEETPGPIPNVVKAALLNYDKPNERMRRAVRDAALVEIPLLERRIGTIAAIAKIAPFLGLLGTVISLMQGFYIMEEAQSYADASLFSGLVGQALTTTAAGLAIAVVGYLAHHFLHGRLRAIVNEMEWVANDIMQFLVVELLPAESTVVVQPPPLPQRSETTAE